MRLVKYFCDRCGKEVDTWYRLQPFRYEDGGMRESDFPEQETDLCRGCTAEILALTKEKATEERQKTGTRKSADEKLKDEIRKRYEAGEEMEEICAALKLDMKAVSRFIKKEGLGEKRYAGKTIPSSGSAPIPYAASVPHAAK